MVHLGPGVYQSDPQKKKYGAAMGIAFGGNSDRKLDNTTPGVIGNPGPGTYKLNEKTTVNDKKPSPEFASKNYSRLSK